MTVNGISIPFFLKIGFPTKIQMQTNNKKPAQKDHILSAFYATRRKTKQSKNITQYTNKHK
jgi:hypothetical protein